MPRLNCIFGMLLFCSAFSANASDFACDPLTPTASQASDGARTLHARDLVELREFGSQGVGKIGGTPFALSADGRRVALVLRRAQVENNGYCSAVIVLDVDKASAPRRIASGGDIDPLSISMYGFEGLVNGAIMAPIMHWSPDGRRIAFTRIDNGVRQIWVAEADGGDSRQLTRSQVDIEDFDWLPEGSAILYRSRPGLAAARKHIEDEGRSGFHYGNRFWPLVSAVPYPLADEKEEFTVISMGNNAFRAANTDEQGMLAVGIKRAAVELSTPKGEAWRAWLAPASSTEVGLPNDLHLASGDTNIECAAGICADVEELWRLNDHAILYLKRTGPARSAMALYRWEAGTSEPKKLLQTDDVLLGCQLGSSGLVCAREGSTMPRRLVRINPATGNVGTIYDPNPEFASLPLNPVERIHWTNTYGLEAFGDLVVPRDFRRGMKLPLIVVQYESRGFLKGGTGDDYPIQLLASHGFAVLSFNKPRSFGLGHGYTDWAQVLAANQRDRMERKSLLASVEVGVRILIDRGLVDPEKIGITGLSDGASTTTFALINSKMFSAASISTCCESPAMMSQLGTAFSAMYARMGYPTSGQDPGYWDLTALTRNADKVRAVPILVQASDGEFRMGLETYAALSAGGWPIDMYVFPGEAHIKNQPAHQLAVYERNVAWFDYWLKSVRDDSYARQEEIDHWMSLRKTGISGVH